MSNWTPETNRIILGLLTDQEKLELQQAQYGWEQWHTGHRVWRIVHTPAWNHYDTYRALPAPEDTAATSTVLSTIYSPIKFNTDNEIRFH